MDARIDKDDAGICRSPGHRISSQMFLLCGRLTAMPKVQVGQKSSVTLSEWS